MLTTRTNILFYKGNKKNTLYLVFSTTKRSIYLIKNNPINATKSITFYLDQPLTSNPSSFDKNTVVLIRISPLTGALMLKTSLLINELTCLLGNTILLVVLCCLSVVCTRTCAHVIPLAVTGCVSALTCAPARAHTLGAI